VIWANNPTEKYRSFMMTKHDLTPQNSSNQAAVALLISGEQAERKLLSDQVTALAVRLDDIASSLIALRKAALQRSRKTPGPLVQKQNPLRQKMRFRLQEKNLASAENRVSTAESSASLNQPDPVGRTAALSFALSMPSLVLTNLR
jgi:hypothetical protein